MKPVKAKKKRGRPSKAAAAASKLGSWDRSADRPPRPKSKRGRSSARTEAARALAARRSEALTPEQRQAIAAAGGRAASHPKKLSKCEHCNKAFGAREMRRHLPQCPARTLARIEARREKRRR